MGLITLTVETGGNSVSFNASTNDADTARLISCYGERYDLTSTADILSKWFENIVLNSKAETEEYEKAKAIELAKNSVQTIDVTFR